MKANINKELCSVAENLLVRFADGRVVATALSDRLDDIVSATYHVTAGVDTPGLALLAVGGYGRREQSAFSDVDIMLLSRGEERHAAMTAEKVLYGLWDKGIQISHAFRTLKTCADDAMKDLQIRTSLFDARLVAGDPSVFQQFMSDVYPRILYKEKKKFLGEVLREIDKRHKKYGESLYLLEPNVKEGRGALRDVHAASWLSRSNLSLDICADYTKIVPNRSSRELLKAIAFLLRVRSALHCVSGRKNDVLSFEFQVSVAGRLGFRNTRSYLAAELLLRVYYRKAQVVADTLQQVMHLCGKRYFQLPAVFGVRKLSDNFSIVRNEIIIGEHQGFLSLEVMLEACALSSSTGKRFSHQLGEQIRVAALRVATPAVFSQGVLRHFWTIMKSDRVYEILSEMHHIRLLEKVLPEFGRLRNLVIFEIYHRYTVDEHTLIAIRNAEVVRQSRDARVAYLQQLFASLRPEFFFFALLVHDIGKGISRRHEGIGYRMLKVILERFAMSPEDGYRIAFLVKNHIVFSQLALRRDPESPETIHKLAEIVGTEENLHALYLMTYADMSAVKPDFWTDWKAYLFQIVYKKTLDILRGVEENRPRIADPKILAFLNTMPERYRLSCTLTAIEADYRMSEEARSGRLITSFIDRPDGTEEITIISYRMQRIFARIVGVLSCRGLNIAQARVYTSTNGVAVRKIIISNWPALWWDGFREQIELDLLEGISGQCALVPERQDRSAMFAAHRYEIFAEIDNEGSDFFTILELHFPDRLGLLYDITTMLYALGIDISAAVINTDDDMAEDIFYLHRQGAKLGAEDIWHLLGAVWNSEFGVLKQNESQ
jgi:[protein-PII] uridylyltransferase